MSTSITTAFVAEYESGVKLAFQQFGSKLRNMVRLKTNVIGSTATFQALGVGTATTKARHADVPPMNQTHTAVTATLADWYAGDYVGYLDEKKITFDEKQAIQRSGAAALGRKWDNIVITAMAASMTTHTAYAAATGLSKAQVMNAFKTLNNSDVPDDGQRYAAVGPHQWNELLNMSEFKSADYIGSSNLPWLAGTEAKRFLNIVWIMHTGLPLSGNQRSTFMWHKSAMGVAEGAEISSTIDWIGEKQEHFACSKMSVGAHTIEAAGIICTYCDDTATVSLA